MDRANTVTEHGGSTVVEGRVRSDRRRWLLGGVAALVAAAVVGSTMWTLAPDGEDTSPPPGRTPEPTGAADLAAAGLAAAEGLAAAFTNHDAAGATPYLAAGTEAPWPEWGAHARRDVAWGVDYQMQPCAETARSSFFAVYSCPFALHLLGSREVGKGPFPDNVLEVTVTDGKVTSAHRTIPFDANGVGDHLDTVMAWLGKNHPGDEPFLTKDEAEVTPAEWPRWTRLWKQYTQEYIATVNEAG